MQRCTVLAAGFGEHEGAVGEIESCQILTASQLCISRAPMQLACNHQMQYQPQFPANADGNALPDPAQFRHCPPFDIGERRLSRSK